VLAIEHEDGSASYARTSNGDIVKQQRPPEAFKYTRENVFEFRKRFLDHRISEIDKLATHVSSNNGSSNINSCSRDDEMWNGKDDIAAECIHTALSYTDKTKIFLVGHSFGGAAVIRAEQDMQRMNRKLDEKIIGSVILDLWPYPLSKQAIAKGIKRPALFINSEAFKNNTEQHITDELIQNSIQSDAYYIKGTSAVCA
jgi:hypothetical protein